MPLTGPDFIGNMDSSNPVGTDSKTIADDQMRNIQEGCRMTFPNVKGEVPATHGDLAICTGRAQSGQRALTGTPNVSVVYFANTTVPLGYTLNEPAGAGNEVMLTAGSSGGVWGGLFNPGGEWAHDAPVNFSGQRTDTQLINVVITGNPDAVVSVPANPAQVSVATGTHGHFESASVAGHSHGLNAAEGAATVRFQPRYSRGVLGKLNI